MDYGVRKPFQKGTQLINIELGKLLIIQSDFEKTENLATGLGWSLKKNHSHITI